MHFSSVIETQTIVPENDFLDTELLEPHEKELSPAVEDEDEEEEQKEAAPPAESAASPPDS